MKAAIIVESFAYGTAKSVKQLAGLLKRDHRVTVYYGNRDGTDVELQDLDQGITWKALPGTGPARHLKNLLFLNRDLPTSVRVIHGHSTYGGVYARLLALFKRKALVLYSPRGYAFLREDYSKTLRSVFWLFERLLAPLGTTVACGPAESKHSKALKAKCVTINNGYDVPNTIDLDAAGDEILCVGRVSVQKGYDIFKEIARNKPNETFVWIGSAGKGCGYVEGLLDDTPENVLLVPYLPHSDLLDKIRSAKFILLPSRWEGLSRVLIEALCHGKAIVTSKCNANVDCLCGADIDEFQYSNGFSCKDMDEYIEAIDMLNSDTALLRSMQRESYAYAMSDFHMDRITDQWRNLYASAEVASDAAAPQPSLAPRTTATIRS